MPGAPPILPPPRGGGKGPKFPMPLDHPSSGLHGLTGSVNAGVGRAPSLRGVTGSYRPPPPPPRGIPRAAPARPLQGLRGAYKPPEPVRGAAHVEVRPNLRGLTGSAGPKPKGGSFFGGLLHGAETAGGSVLSEINKLAQARSTGAELRAVGERKGTEGETAAKGLGPTTLSALTGGIKPVEAAEHLTRTPHDIISIAPALKKTGEAGIEAIKGHPENLLKIAKSSGEFYTHFGREFNKDPALAVAGVLPADRFLGAVSDATKLTKAARADIPLYGGQVIKRGRNPSFVGKVSTGAVDGFRSKILRQQPHVATPDQAIRYLSGGGIVGTAMDRFFGTKLRGYFKPGRVGLSMNRNKAFQRFMDHHSIGVMNAYKPKVGLHAVVPALEGTLRRPETWVEDATKRLEQLRAEHDHLPEEARHNNEAQQKLYEGLRKDKGFRANPEPAFRSAELIAEHQMNHFGHLVQIGHFEYSQHHARFTGYALAHHPDWKYNTNPGPHGINQALQNANRELRNARKAHDRATGAVEGERIALRRTASQGNGLSRAEQIELADLKGQRSYAGPGGFSKAEVKQNQIRNRRIAALEAKATPRGRPLALRGTFDATRLRMRNAVTALKNVEERKAELINSGMIKPDGTQWPRLEDANGNKVDMAALEQEALKETGGRQLGFITHKTSGSSGPHFVSIQERPGTRTVRRTGVSYKSGDYKATYPDLVRQVRDEAKKISGHLGADQIHEAYTAGAFGSKEEAEAAAKALGQTRVGKWVAVSKGPDKILGTLAKNPTPYSSLLKDFGRTEIRNILEHEGGKWGIMPEPGAEEIDHFLRAPSERGRFTQALQRATHIWRGAALFTSLRRPIGTTQENALRLMFMGMSPTSLMMGFKHLSPNYKLGHALTNELGLLGGWDQRAKVLDPHALTSERMAALGHLAGIDAGSMYGQQMSTYVDSEMANLAKQPAERSGFERMINSGVPATVADGWRAYRNAVGTGIKKMEVNTRQALIGKVMKQEVRKFSKEWFGLLKQQDRLVKDYARGISTDVNFSAKHTEDLLTAAGNWTHLSPEVQKLVAGYAPFALWWLNSMKFVFNTMPREHPLKTAALAAMVHGTGADETELKPSYLNGQLQVNLPGLGPVDANPLHYSMFDVAHEGSLTGTAKTAASMIAPQITEPVMQSLGINPMTLQSERLENPLSAQGLVKAAQGVPESLIPFLRTGVTVAKEKKGIVPGLVKALYPTPVGKLPKGGIQTVGLEGRGRGRARPLRTKELKAGKEIGAGKPLGGGKELGAGKELP